MDDLKLIKKYYGEQMSHLCRELFPTILETPGKLFELLESKFAHTKYLYDDLVSQHVLDEFKSLIYNMYYREKEEVKPRIQKTPQELFEEAGYTLYECKTFADVKQFEEYYNKDEELCTFRDIKGRLNRCHIFFAVKKDVDKIKREDYPNPKREDLYGTSVISLQFTKGDINTLSIKNRYNHTVFNPDATFGNNLENIAEGLTDAFEKEYGLNINSESKKDSLLLHGYVRANDERYYKYNCEVDNVYFCPDNVIIRDFEPKKYDTSRYLVFEEYLLDTEAHQIYANSDINTDFDSFIQSIGFIKKVQIQKDDEEKKIIINDDIIIGINKLGLITSYTNSHITMIKSFFLFKNETLKHLNIPNVKVIGEHVLTNVKELEEINLPYVEEIGKNFLVESQTKKVYLPNVERIDSNFMRANRALTEIELPKVKIIGSMFLQENQKLKSIYLPNVENIGNNFLEFNEELESIELPKAKRINANFLEENQKLKSIYIPVVEVIGNYFLQENNSLKSISLPNVVTIYDCFMNSNYALSSIYLPKVEEIGHSFLEYNGGIESISLPSLSVVGEDFLSFNTNIKTVDLPLLGIEEIKRLPHHIREIMLEETFLNYDDVDDDIDHYLN